MPGLTAHDGAHAAERGALELLAPVQRVAKLHEAHKVLRHAAAVVSGVHQNKVELF